MTATEIVRQYAAIVDRRHGDGHAGAPAFHPFTNDPSDGGHHMFEHVRLLFPKVLIAGTKVRLSIGPSIPPAWIVVDLADFELLLLPHQRRAAES